MAYSLEFSPEFFFSEGEPYDVNPVKDNPKPDSVWSAIHAMTDEEWQRMCEDCFPGIEPDYVTPESVMDMIRETDTCSNLNSPVEVWIDSEGYHKILVY